MGNKFRPAVGTDGSEYAVFRCPGCGGGHTIRVVGPGSWTWNGSYESPTVSPSILVYGSDPDHRCHSFIRDGQIQFLADCHHALAGQTVPIPDWEIDP